MRVVKSRLRILVAQKELQERRTLGIRTIASEAGASVSTVQRLLNNTIKRVPLDDLGALCRYFDCDVGDIIRMEDIEQRPPRKDIA